MVELMGCVAVAVLGAVFLYWGLPQNASAETRKLLWFCYMFQVFASPGVVALSQFYYSGGDALYYQYIGSTLADLIKENTSHFGTMVFKLIIQEPVRLPFKVYGATGSTGSMMGFTSLFMLLSNNSGYIASAWIAMFSFHTRFWMAKGIVNQLKPEFEKDVFWATLAVPSVVFWAGGISKEAFAIMGLSLMLGALLHVQNTGVRAVLFMLGFVLAFLIKPYIIAALSVGSLGLIFIQRGYGMTLLSKPLQSILGLVVFIVLMAALFRQMPDYAPNKFAEQTARYQSYSTATVGGSNYEIGDSTDKTFSGQLLYIPVAIVTVFFRPFVFEIRNVLMLVSGIETFMYLWMVVVVVRRLRLTESLRVLLTSPWLSTFVIFALTLAVGVGLSTTNLGTLVRYRIPLVPFAVLPVLILYRIAKAQRTPQRNL